MVVSSRGYKEWGKGAPGVPDKWALPLVPEDPAKLQGPELGARVRYMPRRPYSIVVNGVPQPDRLLGQEMTVKERSYCWSPEVVIYEDGRPIGRGYRHYDWTVVEWPENGHMTGMVVNDTDLVPVD